MKVVLVIPCYNEAKRLNIQAFAPTNNLNFLFVNDGSSDRTLDLLKQYESPQKHILNLDRNLGKAEAVRTGMLEACNKFPEADWIGFWDADLATPLSEVNYLLAFHEINGGKFQAIFASRVMRLGADINRYFVRHVLGRFFVTYSSFMLGSHAYDSQCGAKLFKREIVKETFSKPFISKWFFDMEIIQRLGMRRVKILECPLQVWRDVSGSKINPVVDGITALFEILKIRKIYGKIKNIQ